jgi:glutamate carboxypeptidase
MTSTPQSSKSFTLRLQLAGVPVGSSADVAFAAETGTPCIDGVAILGGGAHGVEDYADLSSIVPRVHLLTPINSWQWS